MMPGMSDTTDPTPRQVGATDTTQVMLPVATAAAALGITSDAVRARIRRGKMHGEKRGGAWFVSIPETERPDSDTTEPDEIPKRRDSESDTAESVTTQGTTDATDTTTVNVALVELVDDLTRRNADLSAAAAMWQTRAAHLEDQLKQLTAGGRDPHEAFIAPESAGVDAKNSNIRTGGNERAAGLLATLRRWLRGAE
jgi:hypothetical protein